MSNSIIVQYYPMNMTVGRYARCDKDCANFIEEFYNTCKASDSHCQSIVMILDDTNIRTTGDIKMECIDVMKKIYG